MDFIFMLTWEDKTVEDCLDILDSVKNIGLKHIGFKDVGIDQATQLRLVEAIKAANAACYMEVVSTTSEAARESIRSAKALGLDCVLGGQEVEYALDVLSGTNVDYLPFVGTPIGHPTQLDGSPEDIAADCKRMRVAGCTGVDLLAYRATEADPIDLVHAARDALGDGNLIVAGSIDTPEQVRLLAEAGVDAFTVGSAVFDGSFSPAKGSMLSQLKDILASCEALH